jgi:hypothetical protein
LRLTPTIALLVQSLPDHGFAQLNTLLLDQASGNLDGRSVGPANMSMHAITCPVIGKHRQELLVNARVGRAIAFATTARSSHAMLSLWLFRQALQVFDPLTHRVAITAQQLGDLPDPPRSPFQGCYRRLATLVFFRQRLLEFLHLRFNLGRIRFHRPLFKLVSITLSP